MRVIEIFKSINGEGQRQGELAIFIRLAGCNLRCSYCDTVYSFDKPIYKEFTINEILAEIKDYGIKNITLTGGEPLIHKGVKELIIALSKEGYRIEIETNGSVNIKEFLDIENVSFTLDYKLPLSNMEEYMDFDNYKYISKKDTIKFVAGSINDLEKMLFIINKYNLIEKTCCIVSPVFKSIEPRDIVEFLLKHKLNDMKLALQIHKFIWPADKRGV